MIFKSYQNLYFDIFSSRELIPKDITEIVAIPRSGVVPALIISQVLNVPVRTLSEFCSDLAPQEGRTRSTIDVSAYPRKVLLVDDSHHSGSSMKAAKTKIRQNYSGNLVTLSVYGIIGKRVSCDVCLIHTHQNRVFEWNMFHRKDTHRFAFDLDGVFCSDPTQQENDDGEKYLNFINTTECLLKPTYKIGAIITSRLEKYREPTQLWLNKNGINFNELIMLGNVTATERREKMLHSKHKIHSLKRNPQYELFIESDIKQAHEISQRLGLPVYCTDEAKMYSSSTVTQRTKRKIHKVVKYFNK